MKTLLAVILTSLAVSQLGCERGLSPSRGSTRSTATSNVDSATGPTKVEVARVANRPLELEFAGLVHGYEQAELYGRVEGFVSEVGVDIGDQVEAGQPLARLDVPELEAELIERQATIAQCEADYQSALSDVDQAKARLAEMEATNRFKQAEHDRVAQLVERDAVNPKNLDEAVHALEASVAVVNRAEKDISAAEAAAESTRLRIDVARASRDKSQVMLDYAIIRAPFDGVVFKRMVDRGNFVRPASGDSGEPLFEIVRDDRLRLALDIDLEAGALLDVGDQAVLHKVKGLPNQKFEGTVARHAAVFDEGSRKLRAEIDLENPLDEATGKRPLKPGYYGQVNLVLSDGEESPSVPVEAVGHDELGSFVMLVEGDHAARRSVQVLFETAMEAWIQGDLAAGAMVVVGSLEELNDGQPISYDSPQLAAMP